MRSRSYRIFTLAITASLSLQLGGTAFAEEPTKTFSQTLRYATFFRLEVDGAPSSDRSTERAFVKAMIRQKATIIDASQSKLSEANMVRALAQGIVSEGLTSVHADVAIAIDARAWETKGIVVGPEKRMHRYEIALDASMVAVDTGQIINTASIKTSAVALSVENAQRAVFERAGEKLAQELLKGSPMATQRVELVVDSLPEVQAQVLEKALVKIPGIRSAKTVYAEPTRAKISLLVQPGRFENQSLPEALAALPNGGLKVVGHSERSVWATFVPARAARFPLLLTRFRGTGKWSKEAPRLLGMALLSGDILSPEGDEPLDLGRSTNVQERRLAKLGLKDKSALFLSGEVFERGNSIDAVAQIRSTRPGLELVVQDFARCPKADPILCFRDVAQRLLDKLPAALEARQLKAPPATSPRLEITHVTFDKDLFSARSAAYEKRGIGHVTLKNVGPGRATHGTIRVDVDGFKVTSQAIQDIAPGEEATFVVPFTFAGAAPEVESRRDLLIEARYDVGGRGESVISQGTVSVLPAYALDWSVPTSIGAFVTEHSSRVRALALQAQKAIPSELEQEPTAQAAALFRILSGMTYVADPVHPGRSDTIDDIQFPDATLRLASGDCDDLAVLYAALAESTGTKAILVLTPRHVLVAIDSGVLAQNAQSVSIRREDTLLHGGRAYIPVETTLTRASFEDAWRSAAELIRTTRGQDQEIAIVDVRDAWQTYPPVRAPNATIERGKDAHASTKRHAPSFAALGEELRAIQRARLDDLDKALTAATDMERTSQNPHEAALAITHRAMFLSVLGRTEEAKSVLEAGFQKYPWPELSNNLGNTYVALGHPEKALDLYERALKETNDVENKIRIHLNLAIATSAVPELEGGASRQHIFMALNEANTERSRQLVLDLIEALDVQQGESLAVKANAQNVPLKKLTGAVERAITGRTRAAKGFIAGQDHPSRAGSLADLVFWLELKTETGTL